MRPIGRDQLLTILISDSAVGQKEMPRCGALSGFAFFSYLLLDQIVRSPIGDALTAIREDEVSASSLGIDCTLWKVFAFGIGSAIAGASGAFYAGLVGTLVPDAFIITESFTILAMVIVGGMGTLIGPVCGAILLTILPEVLRGFGDFRFVLYGLALTLVVLFMPGGIVQATRLLYERFRQLLNVPKSARRS
jgi:branched-chain amino acid transport system permease protein